MDQANLKRTYWGKSFTCPTLQNLKNWQMQLFSIPSCKEKIIRTLMLRQVEVAMDQAKLKSTDRGKYFTHPFLTYLKNCGRCSLFHS